MDNRSLSAAARHAARALAGGDPAMRDRRLEAVAAAIERRADEILAANRLDVEAAADERSSIVDRLTLTPERLAALAASVRAVAALPDPTAGAISETTLANGLEVVKRRVPLGVVLAVYEARPHVPVDAAALCVKAGNAGPLRGPRLP